MASSKKRIKNPVLLAGSHTFKYNELAYDQQVAANIIDDWIHTTKHKKSDMILRIGGVAGSGKSALITYLLNKYRYKEDECYCVAYTGQAVNNLRQRGVMAKTIHSTFMHSNDTPMRDERGNPVLRSGIPVMITKFRPIRKIPSSVKLVICDEASFLPKNLEDMILKYNVPILEIGDPIQLPPVSGKQCFTMDNLDYFMETIMRQAEDSEIIDLATRIRHYDPIVTSRYCQDVKFLWAKPTIEETFFQYRPLITAADMTLVSTNKQRATVNNLYREHILHAESPFPMRGERVVCRKNDWNLMLGPYPLTNGTQGIALHTVGKSEVDKASGLYTMDFKPDFVQNDYFDGLQCDIRFLKDQSGNKKDMSYYEMLNPGKKFEYAHAITVHISQGAEYPTVLFMDSFHRDAEYHMRIRYTAITRARNRLYYVLPYSANYPHWTDLWKGGFRADDDYED